jgi:hypothetical protein
MQRTSVEKRIKRTQWLAAGPRAALLVTFAGVVVASFLPSAHLWGIHFLSFFPVPLRVAALAVVGLTFIPPVSGALWAASMRVMHRPPRVTAAAGALLAILALTLFLRFEAATLLLGDGQLIATSIQRDLRADSTGVTPLLSAAALRHRISPGATVLYLVAGAVTARTPGGDAANGIRFVSAFLGAVFVLSLLIFLRRVDAPFHVKFCIGALAVFGGASQLFFGYVEDYTPAYVLGALYVMSGWYALRRKLPVWPALILLLGAAAMHIEAILLVPSFAYVLVMHRRPSAGRRTNGLLSVFVWTAFAIAYVTGIRAGQAHYFLPVFQPHAYRMFSFRHLFDIAQELLLLQPAFLAFVAAAVAVRFTPAAGHAAGGVTESEFAASLLVPMLAFLVVFNPEIGMSRDWDLFAIASLGLVPFSVAIWKRFTSLEAGARHHLILLPAAAITVVVTVSWIGVNASVTRSVERFEQTLSYDSRGSTYAYETLAKEYAREHRLPDAIRAMGKACEHSPNPRLFLILSTYYREDGNTAAADSILGDVLSREPGHFDARRRLVLSLFGQRRFGAVVTQAREGIRYHPQVSFFYYYLGKSLIELGDVEAGNAALKESRLRGIAPGTQVHVR